MMNVFNISSRHLHIDEERPEQTASIPDEMLQINSENKMATED